MLEKFGMMMASLAFGGAFIIGVIVLILTLMGDG